MYIPPYDIVNILGFLPLILMSIIPSANFGTIAILERLKINGGIIIWIIEAIHVVKTTREERDAEEIRRTEVESRRRRLAELRKHELELVELLEKYAADWDRAIKIRRFADCVELKSQDIVDVKKKEQVLSMLKWARDKADWFDPLVEKEDGILGKSQNLFDSIDWED